jgi:CheY-like chemotaxis protein
VGIPADQLPTLFDKLVQGDASYTRRFGGSGLGLSICRGLAQLMGGSIEVVSTVGQGSVFTAKLPLSPISKSPAAAADTAEADEAQPEIKILAAEDNEVNQLVLRTLLQQAGIDPLMVDNGEKALEAWEREHWDIVLMDIQMPVMDGVSATLAIRAREAATGRARTPIIAVTANAMTHQVPEYRAAGMDEVVPKPVEAVQLFAALQRALDDESEEQSAA